MQNFGKQLRKLRPAALLVQAIHAAAVLIIADAAAAGHARQRREQVGRQAHDGQCAALPELDLEEEATSKDELKRYTAYKYIYALLLSFTCNILYVMSCYVTYVYI